VIRRLRAFGAFWYGFIIGDDWRVAAGVILALTLTATATRLPGFPAWCITAIAVALLLTLSLLRAIRRSGGGRTASR
jgi:hypothetical protein